ncbi:beta-glucosidase 18-like [Coffea eugenioides]|uniref:beta-glucosidase 18-like n=1 Tax=Coffea eugenioides TaxID=49369 RepID=UPI000F609601|nr:beta-glucosidase 18-like [Coffea eugenioides]
MKVTTMLSSYSFLLFVLLISANPYARALQEGGNGIEEELEDVKRSDFPTEFLFGVATSSYQIEGAILEDGKSLSNWGVFVHKNGNVNNGDTGDIATDDYHRYLEDIETIHSLGVDAYRFSISWSRILPNGKLGGVNAAGILFYNSIIDNLLLRGIQPFVTIHHWDIPQVLSDEYGGWLNPLIQDDFVHFTETCFKKFGDRVRYWVTINEPNSVADLAYERGKHPPGHCSPPFGNCSAGNSDTEPLIAMHNMLLAHAKASKLYREQFQPKQGGVIGIVVHAIMYEPFTDDEHDKEAVKRTLANNVAWAFDPLVFGDYPPEMRRYHRNELPKFTPEERLLIRDSIDFLGLNHYATLYAKDCIHSSCARSDSACAPGGDRAIGGFVCTTAERGGVLIGEPTGLPIFSVVPRGMEEIVDYVKNRYHNKPMFITENGYSTPPQQEQVDDFQLDVKRIAFHKAYLAFLARAMRNGADVRGYFVWTLMDDFEWSSGYDVKFGFYSVDRATLNRTPRSSAKWYRNFLGNISSNSMKPRTAVAFWSKVGRAEE